MMPSNGDGWWVLFALATIWLWWLTLPFRWVRDKLQRK